MNILNFKYDGTNFVNATIEFLEQKGVPEPIVFQEVLKQKKSSLAHCRWLKEAGGIDVNGMSIKTTESSQSKIANTLTSLQRGTISSADWKGQNGWNEITLEQIEHISDSVILHVQKCYSVERVVDEKLNSLTTTAEVQDFDVAAAWQSAWDAA